MILTNSAENIRLTRITVPLNYSDISELRLENFKEKLMEEGINEDEIEKRINRLKNYKKEVLNAIGINFVSEHLVSHSAQKIYFVNLGNPIPDGTISAIPDYLKSRIVWVDKDKKIQNSVFEMLEPVAKDLNPIWEKIRRQTGVNRFDLRGHEHGYCLLGEFLTTMCIASKYETEADLNLEVVLKAVNRIKKQITSSQSRALMARIDGILNCYEITAQIPGITPKYKPIPQALLKDLLNDSKMISLSKSRYLLGIPGKFEIAMIKIKRKLTDILAQPRNKKYLGMAYKIGKIATKKVNLEIPEIERGEMFSSPIIDLAPIKPPCISCHRELPDIEAPKP